MDNIKKFAKKVKEGVEKTTEQINQQNSQSNPMQEYLNYLNQFQQGVAQHQQIPQSNPMQEYLNQFQQNVTQYQQNAQSNPMQEYLNHLNQFQQGVTQHMQPQGSSAPYQQQVQAGWAALQQPGTSEPHQQAQGYHWQVAQPQGRPSSNPHQYPNGNVPYVNTEHQHPPSVPQPYSSGNAADILPPSLRPPPPRPTANLLPSDILQQIPARYHSAHAAFGLEAVTETRKGLSRVINLGDPNDLRKLASSLSNSSKDVLFDDYEDTSQDTKIPIFALSYVQSQNPVGRNKLTNDQWNTLSFILDKLRAEGVQYIRLWIDQCLWLRDASQQSWAHIGILPYAIYPVISLGAKRQGSDRTTSTFTRMWPFVEELCGLWSLGIIMGTEMREPGMNGNYRLAMSYQLRETLNPEKSLSIVLLNIFHGAADNLHTGWQADVEELKEMARWNFASGATNVIIGPGWREAIAQHSKLDIFSIFSKLAFPYVPKSLAKYMPNKVEKIYLDGSRMVPNTDGWNGVTEFLSGNADIFSFGQEKAGSVMAIMRSSMIIYNIKTNVGEFQVLGMTAGEGKALLLVAMDGQSSNFSRGRVAWTKVPHGRLSCDLVDALEGGDHLVVTRILEEQISRRVSIQSMTNMKSANIEWI